MINAFTLFIGLFTLFSVGSFSLFEQIMFFIFMVCISLLLSMPVLSFFNKIKFFLLAITIIFSLSVPGEIILFYDFISISREGLELAVNNVLRLSNIFLTVFILMKVLPHDYIIKNIIKACLILTIFGVKKDRLIVRVYLTFEYLELYRKKEFKFNTLSKDIAAQINQDSSDKLNPTIKQIEFTTHDFLWILTFTLLFITVHFFL